MVALKKIERKKRGFTKIEGLDPANLEGTKRSHECVLMIVEGLSAKTYAVAGMDVGVFGKRGRDFLGVFPLTGKILNCRNATASQITKNKVIVNLIKAIGLQRDVDYTLDSNYRKLRYGKILTICDADCDGIHVTSLVHNFFHALFPSLLKRKDPFLYSLQTPIVKVALGKNNHIMFYDEREYRKYVNQHKDKKIDHKYYKGLGTSDNAMVKKTFGRKVIMFENDSTLNEVMNKVFHKDLSHARKDWLQKYDPENVKLKWNGEEKEIRKLKISEYIDTEMIKFSIGDCARSIPHLMDGLKESQRKVLYVALKKKIHKEMKVAQFGAQVALYSGYHHGEQNLFDTIIKMTHAFPGANNIPFFSRKGQTGSRLELGHDSASPRYIFTHLEKITRLLFRPEDDELLSYKEDDGDPVEPEFYVPILPTILINGINAAIGTGWSCTIPCFNPKDIINLIKIWLDKEGKVLRRKDESLISSFPEITPWYRGWNGTIDEEEEGKYTTYGKVIEGDNKYIITEIPIGMSIESCRQKLETLVEQRKIAGFHNYSTPNKPYFEIFESDEEGSALCDERGLKLYTYVHTSNMVMFLETGKLSKIETIDEVVDSYCRVRYSFYIKRKINEINKLQKDITLLGNKKRFMKEVIKGKIQLFKESNGKKIARPTLELLVELEERGYDKVFKEDKEDKQEDKGEDKQEDIEGNEDVKIHKGYDYLLGMQIRSITAEKINKLENDISSLIEKKEELESTSEKQLWLNDIDEFRTEYDKFVVLLQEEIEENKKKGKPGKS